MTAPIQNNFGVSKNEKVLHQLIFEHPVLLVESLEGGVWLSAVHLQDFQAVLMSPTFSFSIWNLTFLVFVLFLLVVTCITKKRLQLNASKWPDAKEAKNVLKKVMFKRSNVYIPPGSLTPGLVRCRLLKQRTWWMKELIIVFHARSGVNSPKVSQVF